jgi:DUF1680 family protein
MTNSAAIDINKTVVKISQETSYPWNGNIKLKIETASQSKFSLRLRVPGWALNQPVPSKLYRYIDEPGENEIAIKVNGETIEAILSNGFVVLDQEWDAVTEIEIDFPMKIRRVIADKQVKDLTNKVALERGPLVYALEEIDNPIDIFDIALNDETQLAVEQHPTLFNGIEVITGVLNTGDKFTAIPYYTWGHRDEGKMTVWMNHK